MYNFTFTVYGTETSVYNLSTVLYYNIFKYILYYIYYCTTWYCTVMY